MKTRRILAASTAALLAFGTTAIVASATTSVTFKVASVTKATWGTYSDASAGAKKEYDAQKAFASHYTVDATDKSNVIVWIDDAKNVATYPADIATSGAAGTAVDVVLVVDTGLAVTGSTVTGGTGCAVGTDNPEWTDATLSASKPTLWIPGNNIGKTVTFTLTDGTTTETIKVTLKDKAEDDRIKNAAAKTLQTTKADKETAITSNKEITFTLSDAAAEALDDDKYEKLHLQGVAPKKADGLPADADGNVLVDTDDGNVIKDLDKAVKKELGKLKASEVEIFEINLDDDGYKAKNTPAPISFTVKTHLTKVPYVYHVNGKKLEAIEAVYKQDANTDCYTVTFKTDTFSPFIVTTTKIANAASANAANTGNTGATGTTNGTGSSAASTGTSSGSTSTNPETGIALAIAPVVLAAGAVAVVALKKKH